MASTAPLARSVLGNLTVNTFGTPTKLIPPAKDPASRKRRIDDVEEPENARAAYKTLLSPRLVGDTVSSAKANSDDYVAATPMRKGPVPKPTQSSINKDSSSSMPLPEEAPTPHSTASSLLDYDPDDTMESQQTAATEVTQPLALDQMASATASSRVSQHAETLRLRLRLAQFKVQTNQINIPFSQLRLSATPSQSPTEKTQQRPSSTSSGTDTKGVEAEEKNNENQPTLPQLLPAAQLTSLTSRLSSIRSPVIPAQDPSSSPQKSASPEEEEERVETPVLPKQHVTGRNEGSIARVNVTSSSVRGKAAAMGLLELRGKH